MKREAALKSAFTKVLTHETNFISLLSSSRAAPDRAIIGNSHTTWWEFKHGTPSFDVPSDQQLMCMRLAAHGYCRFVIWKEDRKGNNQCTYIVHPKDIYHENLDEVALACVDGYNHKWLVRYVQRQHGFI